MVTFADARAALLERLQRVFSRFGELYGGLPEPRVCDGAPVTEPPFYVSVSKVVGTASTSGGATTGHGNWTFDLRVTLFSQHTDRDTAANALLAYTDLVFKAVMADQRLGMTVDNCFCAVEDAGEAADSSRHWMAAATVRVSCTVFAKCPREIKELVDDRS